MLHRLHAYARALFIFAFALLFVQLGVPTAGAQEVGLVEKKVFTLPSYTTVAGQAIN